MTSLYLQNFGAGLDPLFYNTPHSGVWPFRISLQYTDNSPRIFISLLAIPAVISAEPVDNIAYEQDLSFDINQECFIIMYYTY